MAIQVLNYKLFSKKGLNLMANPFNFDIYECRIYMIGFYMIIIVYSVRKGALVDSASPWLSWGHS